MATPVIIYEDNHVLVITKPPGWLSQADRTQDLDVLTYFKGYLKETYHKPGNVYLGLVHRLDQPVSGLMVLAKTSKAAKRLSLQVKQHQLFKQYHCVVQGKAQPGIYRDRLLKDTKTNTTVVSMHGKAAHLEVVAVHYRKPLSLCMIRLFSGRSHQIRVQMAHRNTPIVNDHRYNTNAKKNQDIALLASGLGFYHPTTKQWLSFELPLPDTYPWVLFK